MSKFVSQSEMLLKKSLQFRIHDYSQQQPVQEKQKYTCLYIYIQNQRRRIEINYLNYEAGIRQFFRVLFSSETIRQDQMS